MTNEEVLEVTKRAARIIYGQDRPPVKVELNLPLIVCLVGCLQLSFRHPGNTGAARDIAEKFAIDLIERADPSKGDVYKTLMFGFNATFDGLLDDVPAGEMFTVPVTCPDCGKRGETKTDNPAILHKTARCSGCANEFSGNEPPELDWTTAKSHLGGVIKAYESFADMPGVNVQLALEHVLRPLAKRYESGERSEELYNEMMNVE